MNYRIIVCKKDMVVFRRSDEDRQKKEDRASVAKMVEEKSAHMKDKHSHPPKKDMK